MKPYIRYIRSFIDIIEQQLLIQQRQLILWVPVGIALGAAFFFNLPWEIPRWIGLGIFSFLLCIGCFVLAIGWNWLLARLCGGGCIALAIGNILALQVLYAQPPMPELPRRAVVLSGTVQKILLAQSLVNGKTLPRRVVLSGVRFQDYLMRETPPLSRTLFVRLRKEDKTPLSLGDQIRVRALLRSPPFPAFPGGRDRQFEAWFNNEAGSGIALSTVQVLGQQRQGWERIATGLARLRSDIGCRIRAVLHGSVGNVAAILLVGQTSNLSPSVREDFAESGLAHLLAVAGLHLGIVMAIVMEVSRFCLVSWEYAALRFPCKIFSALLALIAGGAYVLLTGEHLPAQRGWLMASIVFLALVIGRRGSPMRGLAWAACVLLVFSPQVVISVAFQMSMVAVMALIAGYESINNFMKTHRAEWILQRSAPTRWIIQHGIELISASLFAGLATMPVVMAHFGVIEPYFILANLIAVPIMVMWIMPAGLIALCLMPCHWAAGALFIMGEGIKIVLWLAHHVAIWSGARLPVPHMPGWGLLASLLGICWLCLWRGAWRWRVGFIVLVLGCLSPWCRQQPDILFDPTGQMIGIRGKGVLYVLGHSYAERRVEQAWAQALALPVERIPVQALKGNKVFNASQTLLQCGGQKLSSTCVLRRDGKTILILLQNKQFDNDNQESLETLCQSVEVVISVETLGRVCAKVPLRVDRTSAWWNGAQEIFLKGTPSIEKAQQERLWVLRPGGHATPLLPMAEAE